MKHCIIISAGLLAIVAITPAVVGEPPAALTRLFSKMRSEQTPLGHHVASSERPSQTVACSIDCRPLKL